MYSKIAQKWQNYKKWKILIFEKWVPVFLIFTKNTEKPKKRSTKFIQGFLTLREKR